MSTNLWFFYRLFSSRIGRATVSSAPAKRQDTDTAESCVSAKWPRHSRNPDSAANENGRPLSERERFGQVATPAKFFTKGKDDVDEWCQGHGKRERFTFEHFVFQ
jgi:hypothetical protein